MIAINPPANITDKTLSLPGSKYIANRLLILAALTEGECVFDNVPANDDIQTAQAGLSKLGAHFEFSDGRLTSRGIQGSNPAADGTIYTSHSGTFSRFVVAVAALSHDWVSLNGSAKMNSRPMADLFAALRNAGVQIESSENDTLPARIKGPITADTITISGAISSQYISALLLIAAKLEKGLTIQLTCEPVSKPYLSMTIDLLSTFGIQVAVSDDYQTFKVAGGQTYQATSISVPTDPSSASYFLAYAAINGCEICLQNYQPELSLQGEAKFTQVLEQMGCKLWADEQGFHCQGPEQLVGVDVDMGDMPDVVQTLAVVAAFADGQTHITNIENLAFKESNRIEDTATELRKTGLIVKTTADSMTIIPAALQAAHFNTYDDHRMAMSLGLLACKISGITMSDADVVSKSFPTYWQYMAQLGLATSEVADSIA